MNGLLWGEWLQTAGKPVTCCLDVQPVASASALCDPSRRAGILPVAVLWLRSPVQDKCIGVMTLHSQQICTRGVLIKSVKVSTVLD